MLLLVSEASEVSKTTQTVAFALVCPPYICGKTLLIKKETKLLSSGDRAINFKLTGGAFSQSIGFMVLKVAQGTGRKKTSMALSNSRPVMVNRILSGKMYPLLYYGSCLMEKPTIFWYPFHRIEFMSNAVKLVKTQKLFTQFTVVRFLHLFYFIHLELSIFVINRS